MAFELHRQQDLEALAYGGCLFGSGGGGTLASALNLARHCTDAYYPKDRPIRVVSVEEATEGDSVMVAYMGAPLALQQASLPLGPVAAVQRMQAHLQSLGRKLAYVVPDESGALGFVVACLVASRLGLAVVDADGAGRAVPELPMLTYANTSIAPCPAWFSNGHGVCVDVEVAPSADGEGGPGHQQSVTTVIEALARPLLTDSAFNQIAGLSMWAMSPHQLARALPVRNTLTRALKAGTALLRQELQTAEALLGFLSTELGIQARLLFGPGRLRSVTETTTNSFDLGTVVIEADGRQCTVLSQNESLLAWSSEQGQPIAMAPDSVAYFVAGAGQNVFSNGDLAQAGGQPNPQACGRPFYVLGLPAEPALRDPRSLMFRSFAGAVQQMGYYGPYLPLDTSRIAPEGHA